MLEEVQEGFKSLEMVQQSTDLTEKGLNNIFFNFFYFFKDAGGGAGGLQELRDGTAVEGPEGEGPQ